MARAFIVVPVVYCCGVFIRKQVVVGLTAVAVFVILLFGALRLVRRISNNNNSIYYWYIGRLSGQVEEYIMSDTSKSMLSPSRKL